ncbi:hypothetical protein B0H17DRAFT_1299585 [Mycena rosella]|uniref:Uncharacterized protein n=1 Tax=Mycena rosella TaxID=1033263 RepID=A0AAD7DDY5_MYCRO|nr:hypothetical protein B0H17DRAFT_1299585 [Mycena rosella]
MLTECTQILLQLDDSLAYINSTPDTEQVTLGPGLGVQNQSIGVSSSATGFNNVDGIPGLLRPTSVPTVTDNLFKQGTVPVEFNRNFICSHDLDNRRRDRGAHIWEHGRLEIHQGYFLRPYHPDVACKQAVYEDQFDQMQSLFFQIGDPRSLKSTLGGTTNKIYLITADLGSNSGSRLDFIVHHLHSSGRIHAPSSLKCFWRRVSETERANRTTKFGAVPGIFEAVVSVVWDLGRLGWYPGIRYTYIPPGQSLDETGRRVRAGYSLTMLGDWRVWCKGEPRVVLEVEESSEGERRIVLEVGEEAAGGLNVTGGMVKASAGFQARGCARDEFGRWCKGNR